MGWLRKLIIGKDSSKVDLSQLSPEQISAIRGEVTEQLQATQMGEYVKEIKRERRAKRMKAVETVLKSAVPKGIKNPDKMVRNQHLYFGGQLSKQAPRTHKRTRLL